MSNIIFPKDVEIGKTYIVPHVFTKLWYDNLENIFIPINSPKHSDKEYIGVTVNHYHVDWRFLNSRIYKRVCMHSYRRKDHYIRAEGGQGVFEFNSFNQKQIEDKITYKKVKAKRPYSTWLLEKAYPEIYNKWPIKMQKGYCGQSLKVNEQGQYVCPHKGAIIDMKHTDDNGNIVCPAHFLKFNPKTLNAI